MVHDSARECARESECARTLVSDKVVDGVVRKGHFRAQEIIAHFCANFEQIRSGPFISH